MNKIVSLTEYKDMTKSVQRKFKGKCITNLFLFGNDIQRYIEQNRVFYKNYEDGLIIYVDEKEYYRGYYFWNKEAEDFPRLNECVCFSEYDKADKRCNDIAIMRDKFISSGLKEQAKDYQIVIQNDKYSMHDENENKDDINKLKERGLSLLADKVKDGRYQKQVIELWENGLPYENVPYDHKDYLYDNSELWVIVDEDTETVASAIWWNDRNGIRESRHIVTNPLYYGSGLAKILNHYMYYNAIKNEIIEIQSWVAEDNYKSRKMHEGLGWSYSNVSTVNFISQALNEKNNSR